MRKRRFKKQKGNNRASNTNPSPSCLVAELLCVFQTKFLLKLYKIIPLKNSKTKLTSKKLKKSKSYSGLNQSKPIKTTSKQALNSLSTPFLAISNPKEATNFLFLGCGKMGGAILDCLQKACHSPSQNDKKSSLSNCNFSAIKPSGNNRQAGLALMAPLILNKNLVSFYKTTASLPKNYHADIVFLCIKPQLAEEILRDFVKANLKQNFFNEQTIFISILAGKDCDFFKAIFGDEVKIVRIMPNLPVVSGDGIIPYFFGGKFSNYEKSFLKEIFTSLGESFEIRNEEFFHELTAIFGCGPAYIFLLQEIIFKIAKESKIDEKLAEKLVKNLFLGSAKLAQNFEKSFENNSGFPSKTSPKHPQNSTKSLQNSFANLIESVASKGGATEAALEVLNQNSQLENLFQKAIKKATTRSKLLAKNVKS